MSALYNCNGIIMRRCCWYEFRSLFLSFNFNAFFSVLVRLDFFFVLCTIKSSLSFVLAMYLIWTGDWLILCASLAYSIRVSWWSKHAVRMIAASNMNRIRVVSTGTNWFTFVGYSLGVTQSFRTVFAVAIAIANSRCGCPTDFQAYYYTAICVLALTISINLINYFEYCV